MHFVLPARNLRPGTHWLRLRMGISDTTVKDHRRWGAWSEPFAIAVSRDGTIQEVKGRQEPVAPAKTALQVGEVAEIGRAGENRPRKAARSTPTKEVDELNLTAPPAKRWEAGAESFMSFSRFLMLQDPVAGECVENEHERHHEVTSSSPVNGRPPSRCRSRPTVAALHCTQLNFQRMGLISEPVPGCRNFKARPGPPAEGRAGLGPDATVRPAGGEAPRFRSAEGDAMFV